MNRHRSIPQVLLFVIDDATSIEMHGLIRNRMLHVGERISAECLLNDGNPPGQIQWYKGIGKEFLPSINQTPSNGKYVLSRVEFLVSADDHLLPLICQGQVAQFPLHTITFYLNVTCQALSLLHCSSNSFLLSLVPPKELEIVQTDLLKNLSMDDDGPGDIECRASASNPRVYFKVFRRTKTGEEYHDLQVIDQQERSIKFRVRFIF